jgi:hypothetical protein
MATIPEGLIPEALDPQVVLSSWIAARRTSGMPDVLRDAGAHRARAQAGYRPKARDALRREPSASA